VIGERLQRAVPPDAEAARERAWAVVAAAAPIHTTKFALSAKFVVRTVVLALLAGAFVVSGGGAATADWISERVDPAPVRPRVVATLPTSGRLLVRDHRHATVVRQDGSRARLPVALGAAWSPHGLFIATWLGPQLAAIEPDGDPRWRITTPASVQTAAWAPDGQRIAYLAGANELRVVAGDGTADRPLAHEVVAVAWQSLRSVAYVTLGRRLVIRDVDSGAILARSKREMPQDARVVTTDGPSVTVVGPRAGATWRAGRVSSLPAGRYLGAAYSPHGHRLATITEAAGRSTLRIDGRATVTLPGRLKGPVWSPDGRYVALQAANQIVVAAADGPGLTTLPGGALYGWAVAIRTTS